MRGDKRKVAYFGDDYSINHFESYLEFKNCEVVFGASIRPKSLELMKKVCFKRKIPFFIHSNDEETIKILVDMGVGTIFSHSFSMVLSKEVLSVVNGNAYNIHYSLLPRHRNRHPIQWALINDDDYTGFSFHTMKSKVDSGDIFFQGIVEINDLDTWLTLRRKIELTLKENIKICFNHAIGEVALPLVKSITKESFNKKISVNDLEIKQDMSDREIFNLIRSQVTPYKGAFIKKENELVYINEYCSLESIKEIREIYFE